MVIEDMIYLINVRRLPKWLSSEPELFFVDLEQDPPEVCFSGFSSHALSLQLDLISVLLFVCLLKDGGTKKGKQSRGAA